MSVSKKKATAKVARSKGIKLLSNSALLEEAQLKKVLDDPKVKSIDTSEGTGLKPGVPDVSTTDSSKSENESWGLNFSPKQNEVRQTSNGNWCTKGTRIILGWNHNDVDVMVITQDDQAIHTRVWLKAEKKEECIDDIEVMDVNNFGLQFTWNQKPKGTNGILKKLDHVMANLEFNEDFVGVHAIFKPYRLSDHSPSVLTIPIPTFTKTKPFKFFNILSHNDRFKEVVNGIWNQQISGFFMYKVVKKLKLMKKPFRKLLFEKGNLHANVVWLRKELDSVQIMLDQDPFNPSLREIEATCVVTFNEAALMEEHFLKQKAKIQWLKEGDLNSSYFHKMVKSHVIHSCIDVITNNEGTLFKNEMVADVFVYHYEMFLGQAGITHAFNNANLQEVKEALFLTRDDKAPRPDGFTATFFKEAWDIVANDVTDAICEFFTNGKILKELNHTIIALISKIIANRIKQCLKYLVSPNQSAFVPGRSISDNILLTQELMHNYYLDRGTPRYAFKVDIQKAYDTVDWDFLREILYGFGFHTRMIAWIMECVTTTSYSICINGSLHGYFQGKRGLRQELINLCFVDDLFLFAHGDVQSVCVIKEALDEFKHASGLTPKGWLLVKYLRVPLVSSRLMIRDCKELVEKVQIRIQDWKNKSLSIAGRLQLIQSSHGSKGKGKAKVAWEVVCLPKDEGGLGIRRLEHFNSVLMVAHVWKLISLKESLWNWPIGLLGKYHFLDTILVPYIVKGSLDRFKWRTGGVPKPFSISNVWNSIRLRDDKVNWYALVLYASCIPRHAFNMWLIIKHKLKTQDLVRVWDASTSLGSVFPLCNNQQDSHDHLFFECSFSHNVWNHMKVYAGLGASVPNIYSIMSHLLPLAKRRSMKSVISKLVIECIMSAVRLKLLSCRVKKSKDGGFSLLVSLVPWGDSDDEDAQSDDDHEQADDEQTKSDDEEEEKQDDEFIHTPDDYVPIDDETNDESKEFDEEEYEELYGDVNISLKDADPADKEKGDVEMIVANQEDAVPRTSPLLTILVSITPEHTIFNPPEIVTTASSTTISSLLITNLEKDVKKIKNVDHSATLLSTIKFEVLNADKEYLGTSLDDALHKMKHARKQQEPKETITSSDTTALEEFDQKTTLFETMTKSKSFNKSPKQRALYHALMESILEDKDAMDEGVDDKLKKRKQDDADKDKGPFAGSDRGLKKQKTRKDTKPSKKAKSTETSKGTLKSQPKSTVKSAQAEETMPPTPDSDWNVRKSIDFWPPQTWISKIAQAEKPPLSFDELMSTPIDVLAYVMNHLKIDKLTQEHLVGPTFNLLKWTRKSRAKLEYNFEECYKALIDRLDWNNPEGKEYPFDLSKPLPLIMNQGRQVVPVDFFINNDLEYLKGGSSTKKYTTSTTKTKAAKYDIPGIEDMVPSLWIPVKVAYDRFVVWGVSHWVTMVKVMKWYDYGYLEEIDVRREYQQLYKFKEGDFLRLHLHDVKDINPPGIIYVDKCNRNRLMRSDELYKFCDETLTSVRSVLHDIASNLRMDYLPKRRWSNLDKQ
ncbi:hypothetical protein Tco_0377754, partial [Tanacetum coccineum]